MMPSARATHRCVSCQWLSMRCSALKVRTALSSSLAALPLRCSVVKARLQQRRRGFGARHGAGGQRSRDPQDEAAVCSTGAAGHGRMNHAALALACLTAWRRMPKIAPAWY